jgi:hypothetical protein
MLDTLGQIEQLCLASVFLKGRVGSDQFAHSTRVYLRYFAEVEKEFLFTLAYQFANLVMQMSVLFAESDTAVEIKDHDAVDATLADNERSHYSPLDLSYGFQKKAGVFP